MFQKLIKKTNLDVEERTFSVCYYETPKMNGASRYSAEVVFHPRDHMILNADSVKGLETKLACLVRASFYGRMLAETGVAATPGIDFDPKRGNRYMRFSFAGDSAIIAEAMMRLRRWMA